LRESTKIKEILDVDGNISAVRIVEDCEAMVAATHRISTSKPASICHMPLINSLREVSSRMSAFQTSPVAPEGSSCSSALNAARQIAYWSSLFISMMDSSNSVNITSATTSAICTSMSSSVPSSQPPSASSCSLPLHVTTPSSQQAPFPSSVFGQTPTSSSVIPQPVTSSTTNTSSLSSLPCSQPPSASSCSLPPCVTTPSMQQAPSPSSFFGQTPTSLGVNPQPATSSTADTSTSASVSSGQPLRASSRSLPRYVITPSLQQALPPSLLLGPNLTSSAVIPQPATSGFQLSPYSISATSPSLTSSLPSALVTVSAFPPQLSVPSSNARMLSPHPPGSAVIPQSPAASCHVLPSSGQTVHAPSICSLFQSSELSPVSSTLSSPYSLSQFISPSSCTVSSSVTQPASSLQCIGSSLTAQHSSAPSFLQPPSLSSQANSSSLVIDPNTLSVHAKYGLSGQSCVDWLNSLHIQRNVESLEQVKEIWELGSRGCPPLKDWTSLMRNYKSSRGKNTSIYSQRKYMYNFFKQHGFDINSVFVQYNEVKPGKLYKLLNTKGK